MVLDCLWRLPHYFLWSARLFALGFGPALFGYLRIRYPLHGSELIISYRGFVPRDMCLYVSGGLHSGLYDSWRMLPPLAVCCRDRTPSCPELFSWFWGHDHSPLIRYRGPMAAGDWSASNTAVQCSVAERELFGVQDSECFTGVVEKFKSSFSCKRCEILSC
jgi:hypothetical protein